MMEPAINDFWYTPQVILDSVRATIGDYFDPCPIDPTFNGLDVAWGGAAYINPPYSRALKRAFIRKAESEFASRPSSFIWLVNYANSVDLQNLKSLASAVCLPHQRVHFIPGRSELGNGDSPRYDNIILMWGGNVAKFCTAFNHIGHCFIMPNERKLS